MKQRELGSTGVAVSAALLGCGTVGGIGGVTALIGRGLDDATAFATLDEAEALGINVLDTAERYAAGASERLLGRWLRQRPAGRPAPHIATKVAPPFLNEQPGRHFDRAYIDGHLGASLERLGVERVTFYLSHAPDPDTPIEHTLEGFAAARDSGRVAHLGCCNVDVAQLRTALDTADRLGLPGFGWVHTSFSLLQPDADATMRAFCRERGLGYTPFSPLAAGVLTGKYRRDGTVPEGSRMALRPEGFDTMLVEPVFAALDHLGDTAARSGTTPAALALAWIFAHPDCTAPVVGPARSAPHLGHVAAAASLALAPADWDALRDRFAAAAAAAAA